MRKLTDHIVEGRSANLTVEVLDEPSEGGACHHYLISGYHTRTNQSADSSCNDETAVHILFQRGPIDEDGNGMNGIQHEALLAILADRLRGFQSGPYACEANAKALANIESALESLKSRTRHRIEQGIEGTHEIGKETV